MLMPRLRNSRILVELHAKSALGNYQGSANSRDVVLNQLLDHPNIASPLLQASKRIV